MGYSERIKDLRVEKGFTQKELATRLRLTANSICEWEKGRCSPGIDHLIELSKIFECSIDYIVGNSDDFGIISIKNEKLAPTLSQDEQALLKDYRTLAPYLQEMLRATIQTWKGTPANITGKNKRS